MAKKEPQSEKERTGGRERIYVRASPKLKKRLELYCATESMTINEVIIDAIGKYLGIDTSTESALAGALITQARVSEELDRRVKMHTELFLTFVEYFFMYIDGRPKTAEEKEGAISLLEQLLPKYLERYKDSMEQGGRIPDVLNAFSEEDLSMFDQAAAEIDEMVGRGNPG